MELKDYSLKDLIIELKRRGAMPKNDANPMEAMRQVSKGRKVEEIETLIWVVVAPSSDLRSAECLGVFMGVDAEDAAYLLLQECQDEASQFFTPGVDIFPMDPNVDVYGLVDL